MYIQINRDHDFYFELPEYETYLSVYKRPHLDEFLKFLREHTEPILFTKGVKSYAEKVLVKIQKTLFYPKLNPNPVCIK